VKKIYRFFWFIIPFVLVACGIKGSPNPPYTTAPETVKDVKIKQQDGQLVVYWRYIPRYADGRPMKEQFHFEIFTLEYRVIKNINSEGHLYWFNYDFTSEKEYCFRFQVKTPTNKSRLSRFFCYIPTKNYPSIVPDLTVSIVEEGIKLVWNQTLFKTNVYKNRKKVYYPVPLISVEHSNSYLDKKVKDGEKFCYYITFEDKNGVESYPSTIKCVTFRDIFPPLPPVNPTVIQKDGKYFLVWSDSPSKDVIGYIITINGKPLNRKPIKDYIIYLPGYEKGDTIQIYAIDKAGNRSKPTTVK